MHALIFICAAAVLLAVYFVPTMVARSRGHFNATAIFVANLLLGWTILGWAITLTWAFTNTPGYTAQPATTRKGSLAGFFKILLTGFAALCVVIVILNVFMNLSHKHAASSVESSSSTTESTQTGVPTPADQILGK